VLPKSEAELNDLFANGEVDVAMSYDSSFVASAVRKGQFPDTTRPFLLGGGALTNTSYARALDHEDRDDLGFIHARSLTPGDTGLRSDPGVRSVRRLASTRPSRSTAAPTTSTRSTRGP